MKAVIQKIKKVFLIKIKNHFSKRLQKKTEKTIVVSDNTQDIVSTFYYLRNHPTIDKLKVGESINVDMFFDDETTKFKLKFLGYEDIKPNLEP
jgi:hypothetical protein